MNKDPHNLILLDCCSDVLSFLASQVDILLFRVGVLRGGSQGDRDQLSDTVHKLEVNMVHMMAHVKGLHRTTGFRCSMGMMRNFCMSFKQTIEPGNEEEEFMFLVYYTMVSLHNRMLDMQKKRQ